MTPMEAVSRCVIAFEGGDADRASDRGGLTHFGLTLETYRGYRAGATRADLLALSRDETIAVIAEVVVLRPGFWKIEDERVLLAVVDWAIHSGPAQACKGLQRALNMPNVTGHFGPQTEASVKYACLRGAERLFRRVNAQRVRFLGQIIRGDHTQAANAGGWCERVATILETDGYPGPAPQAA